MLFQTLRKWSFRPQKYSKRNNWSSRYPKGPFWIVSRSFSTIFRSFWTIISEKILSFSLFSCQILISKVQNLGQMFIKHRSDPQRRIDQPSRSIPNPFPIHLIQFKSVPSQISSFGSRATFLTRSPLFGLQQTSKRLIDPSGPSMSSLNPFGSVTGPKKHSLTFKSIGQFPKILGNFKSHPNSEI